MTKHTVQPGDWLGAIANAYGLDHWSRIWDHPDNEMLRERRGSPDLVLVGDEIHVPRPDDARGVEVMTGQRVVFRARDPRDVLRLRVVGLGPFVLTFGPFPFRLEAGEQVLQGNIESDDQELCIDLEPSARRAKLVLLGRQVYEFDIGGLGPVDADEGAMGRLFNLGFRGDLQPGGEREPDEPGLDEAIDPRTLAVLTFQDGHDLEPTGRLDDATRARLKREYGG